MIVDILGLSQEEKPGQFCDGKKTRTCFTAEQVSRLETDFVRKRYLTSRERTELARELGMSEQQVTTKVQTSRLKTLCQVKIWFQNRRTKWKKLENVSNEEAAKIMKNKLSDGRFSK